MLTRLFKYVDYSGEDGVDVSVELPCRWAICWACEGEGKSSAHLGAITMEDRERDWDDESWDNYMGGLYDKPCRECDATGKVAQVAEDLCSPAQMVHVRRMNEEAQADAVYEAERAAEIRMGC